MATTKDHTVGLQPFAFVFHYVKRSFHHNNFPKNLTKICLAAPCGTLRHRAAHGGTLFSVSLHENLRSKLISPMDTAMYPHKNL